MVLVHFQTWWQEWDVWRGSAFPVAGAVQDVSRSRRWFLEGGCIFGASDLQICWDDFASQAQHFCLSSITLRGRRSTSETWNGKIAKRIGTRPSALQSIFHYWRKSLRRMRKARRIVFTTLQYIQLHYTTTTTTYNYNYNYNYNYIQLRLHTTTTTLMTLQLPSFYPVPMISANLQAAKRPPVHREGRLTLHAGRAVLCDAAGKRLDEETVRRDGQAKGCKNATE